MNPHSRAIRVLTLRTTCSTLPGSTYRETICICATTTYCCTSVCCQPNTKLSNVIGGSEEQAVTSHDTLYQVPIIARGVGHGRRWKPASSSAVICCSVACRATRARRSSSNNAPYRRTLYTGVRQKHHKSWGDISRFSQI